MYLDKKYILIFLYFFPLFLKAEESKGGMPQLDPSSYISQVFWLVIFFTMLYLLVSFIFFPKIIDIREYREKVINDYIKSAENLNTEANELEKEIKDEIATCENEVNKIIKKSMDSSKSFFDAEIKVINDEIEKKIERATEELKERKNDIESSLYLHSSELSNLMYKKILTTENNISPDEFKKMLNTS